MNVGATPCLALRVTYVGELGWELYCPTEYGAALWDVLWEAGQAHGIRAGGYRAIDALRVEKSYRVWSADITPDDNPFEAGLGFAVKLEKSSPFVGREALRSIKERRPSRRLRCLVLDDSRSVTLGSEPVREVGEHGPAAITGRVTSGGYGFRVGQSIAFAYLPVATAAFGQRVEVEVFGEWVGATVTRDPLWDPGGERIRA